VGWLKLLMKAQGNHLEMETVVSINRTPHPP